ncbi:ATP-binding cassette domain-containing protein [Echinicola jeungdonensis]|uniref:ABC transporter ATP-binding protein n=1 Tax=Echinicola jeungdonensis TaxID=709343 RepID=A0ABV5J813_9BACT|nr:ATP-binding cassette domain-containing protein [Echinicola jeungdonensis]MDN3669976.1 ATP-binding cassette domain-containing protein [Echinicola jeungdonensis]
MIYTEGLSYKYQHSGQIKIPDISLEAGRELLVLGRSGSGKTTLLNILGGLLKPLQGKVIIDGVDLYQMKGARLDKFRGAHIGMVFQKPHILPPLTVEENLKIAQFFAGKTNGRQLKMILEDLGMTYKAKSKVQNLSEGEAQRLSIARALVNGPKVILADEPTASLDDFHAEKVIRLLKLQAHKMNSALIIVTHDQRIKQHISDQIIMGGDL